MSDGNIPPSRAEAAVTWTDPFLDEVHELKRRAWERSGGTMEGLIKRLREIEADYADRLVKPRENAKDIDAA